MPWASDDHRKVVLPCLIAGLERTIALILGVACLRDFSKARTMQPVFFLCGVNPAGTTLVIKPVDPQRRRPFAPEFFLSEWDRQGPAAGFDVLGELLLGLLAVHYPGAFAARALATRRSRTFARDDTVASLDPFDWSGKMRAARLAVGMNYANDALRLVPFAGDKADGFGESISLTKLNLLGAAVAWPMVGEIVLGKVALMHRDAFGPFGNLRPGPVPACGHQPDPANR